MKNGTTIRSIAGGLLLSIGWFSVQPNALSGHTANVVVTNLVTLEDLARVELERIDLLRFFPFGIQKVASQFDRDRLEGRFKEECKQSLEISELGRPFQARGGTPSLKSMGRVVGSVSRRHGARSAVSAAAEIVLRPSPTSKVLTYVSRISAQFHPFNRLARSPPQSLPTPFVRLFL